MQAHMKSIELGLSIHSSCQYLWEDTLQGRLKKSFWPSNFICMYLFGYNKNTHSIFQLQVKEIKRGNGTTGENWTKHEAKN